MPHHRLLLLLAVLCGATALAACQTTEARRPAWSLASLPLPFLNHAKPTLREAWDAWGKQNLRDGDVLFVMGESRIVLGLVNFSRFSADVAESDFSHVGVIAIEDGQPVVYDVISDGTFRRPFDEYMIDKRVWSIAVRRLHPAYQSCVPAAVEFCRAEYRREGEFDTQFRPDNGRYYCAELVEEAFRQVGRPLCEPVCIDELPGFSRFSAATVCFLEATTSLERKQKVFMPGNDDYGLWSCPWLLPVLDKTDAKEPPPTAPLARLPHAAADQLIDE